MYNNLIPPDKNTALMRGHLTLGLGIFYYHIVIMGHY